MMASLCLAETTQCNLQARIVCHYWRNSDVQKVRMTNRFERQHLTRHLAVALLCAPLACGCVSNTLSVQNTQPQPVALNHDPAQRQQAINEIRQKANQPGSGQLTDAYFTQNGSTTTLSPEQRAARIRELEIDAAQNNATASDAELAAKQQSIRELQSQARSHYNKAIKRIEN